MQYRTAVPVLALVALAACSGDKVTSNVRAGPGPVMVVEHTTVQWTDSIGATHQAQLADRLVPQVIVARGGGAGGTPQPRPPMFTAASVQGYPVTDQAGTTWLITVLFPTTGPETYVKFANDTATYAFGVGWVALGDTAYGLAQMQDTVVTAAGSGLMTQTYSPNVHVVPINGGPRSWSPSSWFARGGRAAASLAELLMLPDAAEAQVPQIPPQWPAWVTACPRESGALVFNGLILGGSVGLFVTTPSWPTWAIAAGAGGLFGTSLGDFSNCINGSGGSGTTDTTGGRHPRRS